MNSCLALANFRCTIKIKKNISSKYLNEMSKRITLRYDLLIIWLVCMTCEKYKTEHKIDYIQSRLDSIILE